MRLTIRWGLVFAACGLLGSAFSSAQQRTTLPATRPDREAVLEEINRITARLDSAREKAQASDEYKAAQAEADRIRWDKGNALDSEFEAKDKRLREIQARLEDLRKQYSTLQKELSDVQSRIVRDREYQRAQQAARALLDKLLQRFEPEFTTLTEKQRDLSRQLMRSRWPEMKQQITTQPLRRTHPMSTRPAGGD